MMRHPHRNSLSLLLLAALVLTLAADARAQPRRRSKPATQADIERLEKKIEDQQKFIEKITRLHQEYLRSLSEAFAGTSSPASPPDKPVTGPTAPPVDPKPVAKVDPTPARTRPVKPKPVKRDGMGTIVGKVTGAANAIVYVEDIVAPTRGTAVMKQEGKQFLPQVLVVTKGTTVQFPNRDAIFHNVFSVTPANTFDLGSYRQGESKSVKMSKPGVVTVYCNMHPQMVGHILVVPNGNYVRAGKDGFFRLTNVPSGAHRVVAWAPNAKPTVVTANVDTDEVVTVELALKKGRSRPHTKKDGLPYGSYD